MKFSKYISKAVTPVMALFQKQHSCLSNKATTICGYSVCSLRQVPVRHNRGGKSTENKVRLAPPTMCRLTIGMNESSLQIALLVASVESLTKTEGISFSQFVQKYCETAKKCDIDDMYEIRSKLFHSGEFSFLEFEISMNPYLNPVYEYLSDKYNEYRKIIRKALISWIKHKILTK